MLTTATRGPGRPAGAKNNPKALTRRHIFGLIGYEPTELQWKLHLDRHRILMVAGGERFGKSLFAAYEGLWRMLTGGPREEYWLVAADYARSTAEFNYLCDAVATLGILKEASHTIDPRQPRRLLIGFPNESDKDCIKVLTRSATDPVKLAVSAPRGIIGCEFSQVDYETYLRCLGRLAEKNGWFIMSSSFESSLGWYPEKYTLWQTKNPEGAKSYSCPSWENPYVFPGGREDPKLKHLEAEFSPERFQERHGGVPCPPSGGVFTSYFSNSIHVQDDWCKFNPEEEVFIWVDPGYSGPCAVEAVHRKGDKVYIFDEIYEVGFATGGPGGIIEIARQRPWFNNVKRGTIDLAGLSYRPEGPPVAEIWQKEAGIRLTANKIGINDGIERLKTFLMPHPVTKEPRLYVSSKCRGFISECGGCVSPVSRRQAVYSWKTDREGNQIGDKPEDANNHACLTGDTLIDTPGGRRQIRDMVGEEPYVYCWLDGQLAVQKAHHIRRTRRNAEVICVAMDKGNLYCTPDHLVMLANGNWIEAGRLSFKHSLMALNRYVGGEGYCHLALTNQTRHTCTEHRFVYEQVVGPIPEGCHIHHQNGLLWDNDPSNLLLVTMEEHASLHHKGKSISPEHRERLSQLWKQKWAEDDGTMRATTRANSVLAHEANRGRPVTEETRKKISEASKRVCQDSEYRQAMADRGRGRKHSMESREKVSQAKLAFWARRRQEGHTFHRDEKGHFKAGNHKVIGVYAAGHEDVYDMTVDWAHNFIANGIVVHNCKAAAYGLIDTFGYANILKRRIVQSISLINKGLPKGLAHARR